MKVKKYSPEGGFDEVGAIVLLTAMLVTAAAMGYVAHFIAQWVYLIIAFPVAIGLAVGAVGGVVAKWGKVRSPGLGGACGLACGIAAMLCMHYFDYYSFRCVVNEHVSEQRQQQLSLPEDKFERVIAGEDAPGRASQRLARAMWLADTFPKYMDFEATQGVEIKRTHSANGGGGINLGYVGSYIYWLVEMGVVCLMSWALLKNATSQPFCRKCQQWRKGSVIGYVNSDAEKAVGYLTTGDLAGLAPLVSKHKSSATSVTAYACPKCGQQGEVDLKVERIVEVKKGKTEKKELAFVTYPPQSLPQIEAAFSLPQESTAAVVNALDSM